MSTEAIARKLARLRAGGKPRVLDLFAGCGGLSLGFHGTGFTLRAAVEFDPDAARSYGLNFHGGDARHSRAGDRADETGARGEQFVPEFLVRLQSEGRIDNFVWVSASSATAPYDFKQTVAGAEQLLDGKSTRGIFTNRVHISTAELLEMRERFGAEPSLRIAKDEEYR